MKNKTNKLENYYKSSGKNLSYSKEKYRSLIELTPVGIIAIDMRGNIKSCNELVLDYTGYTRKELIGKNFIKLKLLKVTDIHRLTKMVLKVLKDKKIPKFEISWKHKNGTSYIGEARLRTIKEENRITGFHIAVMDITYKKNTEDFIKLQRDFVTKLSNISNLSKALKVCVDTAIKATGMDCGGVYLVDQETGIINLSYSKGLPNSFIKSASKYSKDSPNAKIVMAGKPIYIQHHKLGVPLDKIIYKEKLLAIAAIPIKHEGNVIACLNIASYTLSEIPVNTRNILESIANQTGGIIARLISKEALRESERKYRLLFERSIDGIYRTTEEGKYLDVNQALAKMLGYKKKEELLNIDIPTQLYVKKLDRPGPKDRKKTFTTQLRRKDGSIIWTEINSVLVRNIDGTIYYEGIVRDITEKKKAEEKLKYLSFHDKLTGLYNRAYFEEELSRLDTKRQLPISAVICDLNSLKLVNDAFGHYEGDKLLKRVANLIKIFFRAEDIIARWGGDEFSIILPKTTKKTAEDIVSRIKKACKKTRSSKIPLSISIGVATKEKPSQNIQSTIREAEDNMYRNKLLEKDSITHSLISSLETSLFEKSHETRKHTDRLNKLAIKLGRTSSLAESELDKLSLLSTLHDIGKVAIPEEILEKEGKLTKSEWNTLKRHPVIGSNICESSPLLVHIANPILCHHEWWDGNGYPRGLKSDDIPIISRIITIVDAYDVMTHNRIYSKAITKDKAIEELKKHSGTQFDPRLVEKFIKIV
jgi:diguanylate cyclase (GGDEF)-like protein/PAS domain S-box-containing protein